MLTEQMTSLFDMFVYIIKVFIL